jgi:hypothetical protein
MPAVEAGLSYEVPNAFASQQLLFELAEPFFAENPKLLALLDAIHETDPFDGKLIFHLPWEHTPSNRKEQLIW